MNPNISKMHKALVFLHYCLERYDCFSIYKIESVRFNFLKFCMQNTAVAYLCRRALLPASSIHNWVYVILHGRKQQLSWSFTKKKSIRYTEIKNPGAGERNQWIQGLLVCSFHTMHLPTTHPASSWAQKGRLCGGTWDTQAPSAIMRQQKPAWSCREFVSNYSNRQTTCFYLTWCVRNDSDLIQNYRTCKILSKMLNSTSEANKTYLTFC